MSVPVAEAPRPLIPGRAWPFVIVGLLLVNVGVCVVTVVSAVSSPLAIEPGYYEKAVAWDEDKAAFADPAALGWSVAAGVSHGMIDLAITDGAGEPVGATSAKAICFHHARAEDRYEIELTRVGDGRFLAQAPLTTPGLWELRVQFEGPAGEKARAVYTVTAP